jgi:hypothetical protein
MRPTNKTSKQRLTTKGPPPPPLVDLPAILEATDLARALRITVVHARRKMARGEIPSRKLGRRRYVLKEVLLRLLRPERGLGPRHPTTEPAAPGLPPTEA